jgi:hypothetical protein
MQRRTLDILFSIGGLVLAVLLGVLGLVLKSNADFANDYVKDQLSQQQITFTAEENLNGENEAEGGECLVEFAGELMTTGKQAECYANQYIKFHMAGSAAEAGYEGATYATLGQPQRELRTQLQEATDAGEDTEAIQEKLDAVNSLRDTMFRGETLRGVLLTSYGFSEFGRKAEQAAWVCFLAALVLLLASIAGFIHAFTTPKDKAFAEVHHDQS